MKRRKFVVSIAPWRDLGNHRQVFPSLFGPRSAFERYRVVHRGQKRAKFDDPLRPFRDCWQALIANFQSESCTYNSEPRVDRLYDAATRGLNKKITPLARTAYI